MRRPHLILASLLAAAVLVVGCGPTPSSETAGSMVPSGSTAGNDPADERPALTSSTSSPQDEEVRRVVDEYIHERTMEGSPYYIDSRATEFVGYEEGVVRQDDRAICRARFTSEKDVYHLQFILAKEMGRYVIHQVVLERMNEQTVRKTLYNRESLVL